MTATPRPSRPLRRLALAAAGLLLVMLVGFAAYATYLYIHVEQRFSGRRWSVPSRVYADSTLLFPGMGIDRALFLKKLERLGYRSTGRPPRNKGEMRLDGPRLEIFLHDLQTPGFERGGFPVRLRLEGDRVAGMRRADTGEELPLLELEPEEIALFFGPEREQRRLVALEAVPDHLVQAVLAAEDNRFYRHHGVDWRGVLRALAVNLRQGALRQGGSTITQQLAKNYFLTPERTLRRKLRELLLSLVIEARYSKDEILEIYLNEIYLGQKGSISINGVGEAAQFYFDKPVERLSLGEAAALAGLIRGPNAYSPFLQPERCLQRRGQVLDAMRATERISDSEHAAALREPIRPADYEGELRTAPYFVDFLSAQLAELYTPEALASLGLSIHTTLDTMVQAAAEQALEQGLEALEARIPELQRTDPARRLQGAVVVMQPKTGAILALVGGRRYAVSQFNRATSGLRQAGSTFKPFVYLAALERFTPVSVLVNEPRTYQVDGKPWSPKNYADYAKPRLSLREALARSVNQASVDLAMQVGLEHVRDTAAAFGFTTPLHAYPSLALGALEVKPLELARAYCVFAAAGLEPFPLALREVRDEQGAVLERRHMTIARIVSPAQAYLMTSLLASAVRDGTAHGLADMGITIPVAGKTGTTNDFRDAWFVGYTPDLLALVWVGFDNGDPMLASGARAALPIWAALVRAIPHRLSGMDFHRPPGVVERTVCGADGFPAVDGTCTESLPEVFLADHLPADLREPTPGRLFRGIMKGVKDFVEGF